MVNSLLHVPWSRVRQGPCQWRWGGLGEQEAEVWQRYGRCFEVLALIAWKKMVEAYHESLQHLTEEQRQDVMEVRYEALCAEPRNTIQEVLRFLDLEPGPWLDWVLAKFRLRSRDDRWKSDLLPSQQKRLCQAMEDLGLLRFGPWPD